MLNYFNNDKIIWEGPDIPCIDLCKGDTVNTVVYNIAKKVCELFEEIDLKDLDYSCIIDKSKITHDIDLFLFFSILLENDCKIKELINKKIEDNVKVDLLFDNIDLKCFLQSYLDSNCTIIRFYNQTNSIVNPNNTTTIFQKSPTQTVGVYYVSDLDQSVWIWDGLQYVPSTDNLNDICICNIEDLELNLTKVIQVIIDNLCQTKSTGIIKACDNTFKVIPFNTTDPNNTNTIFDGNPQIQNYYYISKVDHKIWRWVSLQNTYVPSILTSANIDLSSINACLLNAETSLSNWINTFQVHTEPLITSCLSDTPTALSAHVVNISDEAICNLKNLVGTPSSVYNAHLSKCKKVVKFSGIPNTNSMVILGIPNDFTTFYVNSSYPHPYIWNGFQYIPFIVPLTFTEFQQWQDLCTLLYRIKKVETTCCTPTCDNITVGFSIIYNADDNIFTLTFDKASGTNIPEDFTDCGSTLTATDHKGNKISLDIELNQGVIIELDASTLDLSKNVLVSIKSCLSNGTLTCKNCFTDKLPVIEACGLCKICAVDNSESGKEKIEVFYTVASNPSLLQSSVLYGGQCLTFSLPEDLPTIKNIVPSSIEIVLENDPEYPCNDVEIPAPIGDSCWFFPLPTTSSPAKINVDRGLINASFNMLPDFELQSKDGAMNSFLYQKLFTYSHPNGIILTGEIDGTPLASSGLPLTITGDTVKWNSILPANITTADSSIIGYNVCEDLGFFGEWVTYGTYPIPNSLNSNGNAAYSAVGVSGSVNKNVDYTRTKVGTSRNGILIKLKGQPLTLPNVPNPEISLKDPISNNIVYIKGELVSDDCQCPS